MKKHTLAFAALLICSANLFAINKGVEDTALVRISTPEARAVFLSQKMKEKLELTDEQLPIIEEINLRYEAQLQELTIANPASLFKSAAKKKGNDKFDDLSSAREKEIKKALKGKQYKEYEKNRWGLRSALKTQMNADKEERDREEREKAARELAELQAKQQAQTDSIANASLKNKKGKKGNAMAKKGKAPAKKGAKKKK
ncbi:MAG: hypothetical protein LBK47_02730 [Prevotellaceae bacterium]|jgi:coenzyme F420-reducing hydrogenase alpha subunit|nr:hypothetical protein [Prevotellaceae bacterium]